LVRFSLSDLVEARAYTHSVTRKADHFGSMAFKVRLAQGSKLDREDLAKRNALGFQFLLNDLECALSY